MHLIDTSDLHVIESMTSGGNLPGDLRGNAMAIRLYGDVARQIVLKKRRERRAFQETWQRKWAERVSRRPQRGSHHDSWAIRESYVRYSDSSGGSYVDFIDLGHAEIQQRAEQGATRLGMWIPQWLDAHASNQHHN